MWYRIAKRNPDSRPLFIFDIDDTLVTTAAKILVKRDNRIVAELTPAEYNTFDIQNNPIILKDQQTFGPGIYDFDYSQFMDSLLFQKTSAPIAPMIRKVKALLKNNPHGVIIFNTARSDFDSPVPVLNTFKDLGLPMDKNDPQKIHVNRSGNYRDKIPTSEKKNKLLLDKYLTPGHQFTSVHFWDDDAKNLDAFLRLNEQEHLKDLNLKAYRVKHDGSTEVWNDKARQRFEQQLAEQTKEVANNVGVPALPQNPEH